VGFMVVRNNVSRVSGDQRKRSVGFPLVRMGLVGFLVAIIRVCGDSSGQKPGWWIFSVDHGGVGGISGGQG
jgi:hypothetical protein